MILARALGHRFPAKSPFLVKLLQNVTMHKLGRAPRPKEEAILRDYGDSAIRCAHQHNGTLVLDMTVTI
jgi:hypothetical protein